MANPDDDWTPAKAGQAGLGWVPKGHPLYGTAGYVGSQPGQITAPPPPEQAGGVPGEIKAQDPGLVDAAAAPPPVAAAPAPAADMDPGAAAAAGLGWVPKNHPLYGTPGYVGSTAGGAAGTPGAAPGAAPGTTYTPPNAAPGTPGTDPIDTQGKNAQTYSSTPGAAPSAATTNQGTQDVVRNTLLERATQGTTVDTNDPNFRQQADAFAAAQERARRNAVDDAGQAAFASGMRGSGAERLEQRMATESASRATGQFEAELVGRELQTRRSEISDALNSLKGQISVDQQMALQRELAALDAAIKKESLAQSGSLGSQDLSLRDKLGTGALNVDLMRALLSNQQFDKGLGVDIGKTEIDSYFRSLGL